MKKLVMWTVITAFALSLAACAGMNGSKTMHVKCPSCGYEFDVQTP